MESPGCRLFSEASSIGIHLIGVGGQPPAKRSINPRSNHLAFTTTASLAEVQAALEQTGVEFVRGTVQEGELTVDQVRGRHQLFLLVRLPATHTRYPPMAGRASGLQLHDIGAHHAQNACEPSVYDPQPGPRRAAIACAGVHA